MKPPQDDPLSGVTNFDPGSKPRLLPGTFAGITERRIGERTCRLFDYQIVQYRGKTAHAANYKDKHGLVICQHIRQLDPKGFSWIGRQKGVKPQLFGQHLGSRGDLFIFEGELDAMSGHECLSINERSKCVCVSVPDGAQSAAKAVASQLQWVLGFERVTIFFDDDEPGINAAHEVAAIIGPKARIVTGLGYKDCSEAWVADDASAIKRAIVQAVKHRPQGVVNADDLLEQVLNPEINRGFDLPWDGWTSPTEGLKEGELWMISGGTGIGKSLYSRSIALHLCKQKINVAYIGLEESVTTTYERMLSEALGWNLHTSEKADRLARKPEITAAAATFAPHLFLLDKFGSDDFSTFVATVKHYVLNEQCKVVVLDHFSLLADGIALNVDQRRAIDKGIKDLKTLAMELNFTFIVVCHLSRNSGGLTPHEEGGEPTLAELRGSQSLAQIPDYVWMLVRNPNHPDKDQANITKCWLKKNRVKGEVGHMASLQFSPRTCRFTELAL